MWTWSIFLLPKVIFTNSECLTDEVLRDIYGLLHTKWMVMINLIEELTLVDKDGGKWAWVLVEGIR